MTENLFQMGDSVDGKGKMRVTKLYTGAPGWLSVEHLTLDFGSGHDLTLHEMEPCVRLCADGTESA